MRPTNVQKGVENRVRRMAGRQGLALCKSYRRDPLALSFGRWRITDIEHGAVVFGGDDTADGYRATLAEAEAWLRAGGRNQDRVMVSTA